LTIEVLSAFLKIISCKNNNLNDQLTLYNIIDKEDKGSFTIEEVYLLNFSLNDFLANEGERESERGHSIIDRIFSSGQKLITKKDFLANFGNNSGIDLLKSKINEVNEYIKKKLQLPGKINSTRGGNSFDEYEMKNCNINNLIINNSNISAISNNNQHNFLTLFTQNANHNNKVQLTNEFIIVGKRNASTGSFDDCLKFGDVSEVISGEANFNIDKEKLSSPNVNEVKRGPSKIVGVEGGKISSPIHNNENRQPLTVVTENPKKEQSLCKNTTMIDGILLLTTI